MFEMFTLGHTPYPLIEARAMIQYLEEGNRLPRPRYADDEMYVYKINFLNLNLDIQLLLDVGSRIPINEHRLRKLKKNYGAF